MSLRVYATPTAPVEPLIETFVLGELTRQFTLTDQFVRLHPHLAGHVECPAPIRG